MMKNVLKNFGITDVSGYFHVDNVEKELGNWSPNIRISYRGYMLGYYNLNTTGITAFYRFLAKVADGFIKMRIIRMDFKK